ncbi:MAG TPA: hypothetical protein VFG28_15780 [Syntrophales bacterium]|nr:hypothetical protein [Syntrophales bacterium]
MHAKGKCTVVFALALLAGFLLMGACAAAQQPEGENTLSEPPRISPAEAYQKAKAGTAVLVCAYPDDETFRKMQLEGAISYKEFESRLPGLKKDQEIIFY